MGYWGTGPFESDDALDVVDGIVGTLVEEATPERGASDVEFSRARSAMNVLIDCPALPLGLRQKADIVASMNRLLMVLSQDPDSADFVTETRKEIARFAKRKTIDEGPAVPATLLDPEDLFHRRGPRRVK